MKLGLTYTNSRILRHNFPLLIGLCSLCLVSMLIIYLNVAQYNSTAEKVKILESELEVLQDKKSLIDFKSQVLDSRFNLDTANQVLSQLIPAKEDYFSILGAFERLSAQTNFIVTSYNILVADSTPERLAILIEGQGDPDSFLEFLKEYNFSGGRLITIDDIEYSQEALTGVKINIYVYNGSAGSMNSAKTSGSVDMQLIDDILKKVQIEIKPEQTVNFDYPTKSNPF